MNKLVNVIAISINPMIMIKKQNSKINKKQLKKKNKTTNEQTIKRTQMRRNK